MQRNLVVKKKKIQKNKNKGGELITIPDFKSFSN